MHLDTSEMTKYRFVQRSASTHLPFRACALPNLRKIQRLIKTLVWLNRSTGILLAQSSDLGVKELVGSLRNQLVDSDTFLQRGLSTSTSKNTSLKLQLNGLYLVHRLADSTNQKPSLVNTLLVKILECLVTGAMGQLSLHPTAITRLYRKGKSRSSLSSLYFS
jgi:hypothetical protein